MTITKRDPNRQRDGEREQNDTRKQKKRKISEEGAVFCREMQWNRKGRSKDSKGIGGRRREKKEQKKRNSKNEEGDATKVGKEKGKKNRQHNTENEKQATMSGTCSLLPWSLWKGT